eukprot:1005668-Rhodomonas_salina.2
MPTVNGWKADGNSTLDLKSSDPNGLKGFMSVISVRDIFPRIASGNILLLLQCSKEVRCQVSNEVIPVSHLNLRALNYDERHRQGYACQHPHIHTGAVKCFRTSFCRDSEIVVNYDIGASGCPLCLIGPLLSKVSKAASVGIVLEEVCSPVQADVFAALAYLQRTAPGELKLQRLHWESTNSQQVGHEDDMYFSELCPTGTVVMALSGGGLRDVFLRDVPDRVVLAEISSALLQSMDTVRRVDIMDDRSPRERTRCDEKLGELHHSIPTLLNALQTLTSMEQLCLRGKGISLVVAPMTVIEAVFDSAKNLRILKLEHIPLRVHLVPPLISAIVRKIGHCLEGLVQPQEVMRSILPSLPLLHRLRLLVVEHVHPWTEVTSEVAARIIADMERAGATLHAGREWCLPQLELVAAPVHGLMDRFAHRFPSLREFSMPWADANKLSHGVEVSVIGLRHWKH